MNGDCRENWGWADQHMPEVKQILKQHAVDVVTAPLQRDMHEATDLEIRVKARDIAVRIRRPCEFRDLTIRAVVPSGRKTELAKIQEGYGDYYFYGWSDNSGQLADWIICDLDQLRRSGLLAGRELLGNGEKFIAIPVEELDQAYCLVARKGLALRNVTPPLTRLQVKEGRNDRSEMAGRYT